VPLVSATASENLVVVAPVGSAHFHASRRPDRLERRFDAVQYLARGGDGVVTAGEISQLVEEGLFGENVSALRIGVLLQHRRVEPCLNVRAALLDDDATYFGGPGEGRWEHEPLAAAELVNSTLYEREPKFEARILREQTDKGFRLGTNAVASDEDGHAAATKVFLRDGRTDDDLLTERRQARSKARDIE
jgi:hypothetical protein